MVLLYLYGDSAMLRSEMSSVSGLQGAVPRVLPDFAGKLLLGNKSDKP